MSPALQQDLQTTNRIFEQEVVAERNIDALDRVYTSSATVLPPGGEMVTGRENIKGFWRTALEALGVTGVRLETVSFEPNGDTGYEIGRATLEFGGAPSATGKYVVVWKREDGAWKWHVDIWNMSA
jgi:ketosteroid isomerase-like protein